MVVFKVHSRNTQNHIHSGNGGAATHTDKAPGFPFSTETLNPSTAMWPPDPTPRSLESFSIKILPLKSPADLTRNKPPRSSAKAPGSQAASLGLWQAEGNQELEGRAVCTSCSPVWQGVDRRREEEGWPGLRLFEVCAWIHCMLSILPYSLFTFLPVPLPPRQSQESFTSTFHVKFMSLCD